MKLIRDKAGRRGRPSDCFQKGTAVLFFLLVFIFSVSAASDLALRAACLSATVRAVGLEIMRYEMQLNAAKNGPGNPATVPGLENAIARCKDELAHYAAMSPSDYVLPESKEMTVTVERPYSYGDFLDADGMSKSGPFYHIAGISGDDLSVLVPGRNYRLKIYILREKDYVLPFPSSWYVYVDTGAAVPESAAAGAMTGVAEGAASSGGTSPLSLGPRQLGEEILEGLSTADRTFTIRVGSNGCTTKESFRVVVEPRPGIAVTGGVTGDVTGGVTGAAARGTPHYVITIYRVLADECKAIVEEGVFITFDLEKDLGIKGPCTYSITNRIYSVAPFMP